MSEFLNINKVQIDSFISKTIFPKTLDGNIDYDKCWLFDGFLDKDGYGKFALNGQSIGAHRVSYYLAYNIDPTNHIIMHKCDIPNCVNPIHLQLGTTLDNIKDKLKKNRQAYGEMISSSKLSKEKLNNFIDDIEKLNFNSIDDLEIKYSISKTSIRYILKGILWRRDVDYILIQKKLKLSSLRDRFLNHCKLKFKLNLKSKFNYEEIKQLFIDILNYTHKTEILLTYECSYQSIHDLVRGKFKSEISNIVCEELGVELYYIEFLYFHGSKYKFINQLFSDILTGIYSRQELAEKYNKDISTINKIIRQKLFYYESELFLKENNLQILDIQNKIKI
jgi:hypothetical protein